MSADEVSGLVEVLYDYSYEDESGIVSINVGDTYTLVEKTNEEWWQVVRQQDEECFFVPAQYVRIIPKTTEDGQYQNEETHPRKVAVQNDKETTPPADYTRGGSKEDLTVGGKRPVSLPVKNDDRHPKEEVLYANLEDVRATAGLPSSNDKESAQPHPTEYANLPMAGEGEGNVTPNSEEGANGRRLVDYLPWFIHNEHGPGRPFYINIDTGEVTYKPPRHKNQKIAEKVSPTIPNVIYENPDDTPKEVTTHLEYDEIREDGKLCYVHKKTKEKYEKINNESGSLYYFDVKTGQTYWELPTKLGHPFHNGDSVDENRNPRYSQSLRLSKAKSMCEPMDYMKGDPNSIKAHTLPPSFSYGSKLTEPLKGTLNKAKIADLGKKVKKTWSQSYVVLQGSNLIFYKDQKASLNRPGSPHGKSDFVVNLLGAKIDFNSNKKNISSKKNVITLTTNSNNQFLLQSDSEEEARKWLTRLKIAADDLKEERLPENVKPEPIMRSHSMDEGNATASNIERQPSINSTYFKIRAKLFNLITRRPTQEELFKRGIIKDVVFGSHLEELCKKEHNTVPNFVKRCIAAVEKKGLDHDGLYRVSGNLAEIQKLRFRIDKEEAYNLDDEDLDIHVLTGTLKLFFRELKEPLFPFNLFDRFTSAINKEKNKDRLRAFKDLMAEVPKCNRETMNVLFHHLRKVIEMSHENRMQTQNVAIVFGPTLMWSNSESGGMAVMTIMQSRVVEYMLLEYDEIFR